MLVSAVVPVQICIGFIGIFVVLVLRKVRAHIFMTDKADVQTACYMDRRLGVVSNYISFHLHAVMSLCPYEYTSIKAGHWFKAHVLLVSILLPRGQCSV